MSIDLPTYLYSNEQSILTFNFMNKWVASLEGAQVLIRISYNHWLLRLILLFLSVGSGCCVRAHKEHLPLAYVKLGIIFDRGLICLEKSGCRFARAGPAPRS